MFNISDSGIMCGRPGRLAHEACWSGSVCGVSLEDNPTMGQPYHRRSATFRTYVVDSETDAE